MTTVSAIIPVHNGERYVSEAIASVFGQTRPPIECIVVDDGSTDSTPAVVQSFSDVKYLRLKHGGVSLARNHGAQAASGELVAFLDHDDVWLPWKLERQVEALDANHSAVLAVCAGEIVDPDGDVLGVSGLRTRGDLVTAMLMHDGADVPSCSSTGLIRRDWLMAQNGFDTNLSMSADWDLTLRAALEGPIAYVDEPLVRWRMHGSNMSYQLDLLEHDKRYAFRKAFSDPRLPESLRERRHRALGRMYRMLAGSYRDAGQWTAMVRMLLLALRHDPGVLHSELSRQRQHD